MFENIQERLAYVYICTKLMVKISIRSSVRNRSHSKVNNMYIYELSDFNTISFDDLDLCERKRHTYNSTR